MNIVKDSFWYLLAYYVANFVGVKFFCKSFLFCAVCTHIPLLDKANGR